MKRVYGLTIVILILAFSSIEPRPTANQPGAVSTKTSIPYNQTPKNFWFLSYDGFKEDKLVIGKTTFDKFITIGKERQRRTFDSLGRGKFKVMQPPSCVHLTSNLFIDEAEITNIDYHEFLFYLKRDSTKETFNKALPQIKIYDFGEADYFASQQYRFFPVVGLTHEQAIDYCRWRSQFVTSLYRTQYKKSVKFKFRLPTESEWELAASNGLDKSKYEYGIEGQQTISFRINKKATGFILDKIQTTKSDAEVSRDILNSGIISDIPFNLKRNLPYFLKFGTPYYTYSFYRNDYGIYNLIGNVAEMIDEKGVAKGGSYKDDIWNSKITGKRNYVGPTDDIGFRCICEVE